METVTLQPQTQISLTALIKSWNQDPLALNNSLIITKDTAIVTDGITILFSLQLSIEDTDPLQNNPLDSYTETTIELPSNENWCYCLKIMHPKALKPLSQTWNQIQS